MYVSQPGSPSPRRFRTVGSASAPNRMPIAVMPTCTVEITRTGSSISRSAARAPAEPASARGTSAARRAVTIAYSPITKNALPATRTSTASTRSNSDISHTVPQPGWRPTRSATETRKAAFYREQTHVQCHRGRQLRGTHLVKEATMATERGTGGNTGGIGLGGILVIIGIVLMIVWSFWIGLIVTLVGLIAFGGFAKGKWY